MERFAAQAAAREQEKADKEAVVPLLNETENSAILRMLIRRIWILKWNRVDIAVSHLIAVVS